MRRPRYRLVDPTWRYLRTSGGRVVHTPGCRHVKRAYAEPWLWADDKTPDEIDRDAAALGLRYRWCADCVGRRPIPREAPRGRSPR